jgi:hypothetical protein
MVRSNSCQVREGVKEVRPRGAERIRSDLFSSFLLHFLFQFAVREQEDVSDIEKGKTNRTS